VTEIECIDSGLSAIPDTFDVVVVGAGVAGSYAAWRLARAKRRVLLVERAAFPRYKVCGCCLNLRSLALLEPMGIPAELHKSGAIPLTRAILTGEGRRADLPLPGGLAVSRSLLDDRLARAAQRAGATVVFNTRAALGPVDEAIRTVHLHRGTWQRTVAAHAVIAASGLSDNLLSRTGESHTQVAKTSRVGIGAVAPAAPGVFEAGAVHMACSRHGYAGCVQVEAGQLMIAAAVDPRFLKETGGPAKAVAEIARGTAFPESLDLDALVWKGTPPLTRHARPTHANRVILVGDSSAYVEPFTGEGMAWALAAAQQAAELIEHGVGRDWEHTGRAWERLNRRAFIRRRLLCHATARLLRSPFATQLAIGALSKWSSLSGPLVKYINASTES
jgi:flavin-dependent dehydrogenase